MQYENHSNLTTLITHFIKVSNSIKGQNSTEQQKYGEAIARKVFSHICSVYSLSRGHKLLLSDDSNITFVDHASMAILTRAALESYLTFNHIFIVAPTVEERLFRFQCWDLAGCVERINMKTICPLDDEQRKVLGEDKERLAKLLVAIEQIELYKNLKKGLKTNLEKYGKWRLDKSWADLVSGANFDKNYFEDTDSYLCSYAHTGRSSALQVMHAYELGSQTQLAESYLDWILVILSKFFFDYLTFIPELEYAFESSKQAVEVAEKWKWVGENCGKVPITDL
ncbi:MAG: hypothetical protein AAF944_29420 [Bacteroidota bacterium]